MLKNVSAVRRCGPERLQCCCSAKLAVCRAAGRAWGSFFTAASFTASFRVCFMASFIEFKKLLYFNRRHRSVAATGPRAPTSPCRTRRGRSSRPAGEMCWCVWKVGSCSVCVWRVCVCVYGMCLTRTRSATQARRPRAAAREWRAGCDPGHHAQGACVPDTRVCMCMNMCLCMCMCVLDTRARVCARVCGGS